MQAAHVFYPLAHVQVHSDGEGSCHISRLECVYEDIARRPWPIMVVAMLAASHGANDVHQPCIRILHEAAASSRPSRPQVAGRSRTRSSPAA